MKIADFKDGGPYQVGRVIGAVRAVVEANATEPPRRYTQSDLLDDMIDAHKFAKDAQERVILKQIDGLGTARTRESTITSLVTRGFLVEKKSGRERGRTELIPTQTARMIISELPEMLTSVGTTAKWELAFRLIEQGKAQPEDAEKYLRQTLLQIVREAQGKKGKITLPTAAAPTEQKHFGKTGTNRVSASAGGTRKH
jgi:DNA topoisomerase IA